MERPLADYIFAACVNPVKMLESHPTPDGRRKLGLELKTKMREARRFFVDEEVTRAATTLGIQHPDILMAMLRRARLPFSKVWVEWDNRAQIDEGGQIPADDSPERIGALIERLDDHNPLYRLTTIGLLRQDENNVVVSPISVIYNLDEAIAETPMGSDRKLISDISRLPEAYISKTVVGSAYVGNVSDVSDNDEVTFRTTLCDNLSKHAVHVLSPFIAPIVRETLSGSVQYKREAISEIIRNEVVEQSGTWRFIISLFALINSRDYVESEESVKKSGGRFVSGKMVPYLDHYMVKLKLPRKVVAARIVKEMAEEIPRRRHEVIGHWKASRKRWPADPNCDHAWVNETAIREVCSLCGHKRWWVNEHMRGSAEVGFVTKDRLVTKD